jgi:tRNA modification GTPase
MFTDDTIAAISTSLGRSGIGIIRLSGKNAIKIADTIFVSPKKRRLNQVRSHTITYGHIVNKQKEIIDEVLVSVMKAPHTYTREDIVEINCHGGHVPLRRILDMVLRCGARLAEPGEFTQRAFMNGRIDLAQAEAVLDVINALTEQSQKAAIQQLRGRLSGKIENIRDELIRLTAFVEAHIDFPEDDISPPSLRDMEKMAFRIQHNLEKLLESSKFGMILREGLKTAIVGRPNVGKSSLLNALLEHDRAIVTDTPGTTRDVIEEYLNVQGIPIKIMDTAGIREVKGLAEKEGVKRSLSVMKDADLVIVVLDGSKGLTAADRQLIETSRRKRKRHQVNTLLVINKTDLPQKIRMQKSTGDVVRISAKHGTGLDGLKAKIAETALNGRPDDTTDTGTVTNARHVLALENTLASIKSFTRGVAKKTPPELLAVELRDALDSIGQIIGITTAEDILNTIFKNFCIGK